MIMSSKNILFVSVQGGMGHVTRDLAIVRELHRLAPEIKVSWLAHAQAARFLEQAGEEIFPNMNRWPITIWSACRSFGIFASIW